jgi:DNA polymerase-3 subunit chi
MPKIDFYILSNNELEPCYRYMCRVIEKAYKHKHKVYIHAENQKEAQYVDELLWTFEDTSFIPHNFIGEGPDQPPPVQLGHGEPTSNQNDILINLSGSIPEFHQRFRRILEFIPQISDKQDAARERFRSYKEQGYTVNSHNISKV